MAGETLSECILRENEAVFDAMVRHRFTTDIEAGHLPSEVFDRYLVYEGAFVETAISIFALATAKAGRIEQKRWLISVLDDLANQQIAYFERTLAARGIDPASFNLAEPRVAAFCAGMLDIAEKGPFLDIIVAMFAAEWMYLTWSKRVAAAAIADPLLNEWVAMHADDTFANQAEWLRRQIDDANARLDEAGRSRLSAVFGRVQALEIAFHDAAYGDNA
ncbi:TenA family protein [Mesorhizobium sp. VK22B]|uniref:Aminopyrimidine aminohydrolase n=1 Tax=Mesorhizobium captivum TaxID=3072319 RepID=A0ABU4Z387_9HYPH|nr:MULTISPECIES: TenA family protein [unclassified Mesorhizobium]MDX8492519.1 TenA family protein [Mesorhizobium sp. VK22B]MDX8505608.1 TenA family protein [Mesorhizobium sp. VK22E]